LPVSEHLLQDPNMNCKAPHRAGGLSSLLTTPTPAAGWRGAQLRHPSTPVASDAAPARRLYAEHLTDAAWCSPPQALAKSFF